MMVTGTREGGTEPQLATLKALVLAYAAGNSDGWGYESEPAYFTHGDCVGVDSEFHDIALDVIKTFGFSKANIKIYPPINPKFRAFRDDGAGIMPEKEYLERNRDMVDAYGNELVVVVPKEKPLPGAKVTGGTWYTADYATTKKRTTIVIWPDGSAEALERRFE